MDKRFHKFETVPYMERSGRTTPTTPSKSYILVRYMREITGPYFFRMRMEKLRLLLEPHIENVLSNV